MSWKKLIKIVSEAVWYVYRKEENRHRASWLSKADKHHVYLSREFRALSAYHRGLSSTQPQSHVYLSNATAPCSRQPFLRGQEAGWRLAQRSGQTKPGRTKTSKQRPAYNTANLAANAWHTQTKTLHSSPCCQCVRKMARADDGIVLALLALSSAEANANAMPNVD